MLSEKQSYHLDLSSRKNLMSIIIKTGTGYTNEKDI